MSVAQTPAELARMAQAALRTSGNSYRVQLKAEVHQLRHEQGLHKMLDYAKEMRAKALNDMASGTKEKFDTHQSTWRAWDDVCATIEMGPGAMGQNSQQTGEVK